MPTTMTAALLAALLAGTPAAPEAGAPELAPSAFPSLLGAESLRGATMMTGAAGYSTLGVIYGQGLTHRDDLLLSGAFDWTTSELKLGAAWRRPIGALGGWDAALRLGLGWYASFGATWMRDNNHSDRGLALDPALVFSSRAGDGLVSATAEFPLTFTFWRDGGFLLGPKASVAYEAPLYQELTVGARAGVAWRGGGGDAPMRAGRAEAELLFLVGYRFL